VDTAVLVAVRDRLAAWERVQFGDLADAYHRGLLGRYVAGLRALIDSEPDRERGLLLAVLALGPRNRGLPGAADIEALVPMAAGTSVDMLGVAIAWGAGWGRQRVWPGHDWHGRWAGSVLVLAWMVRGSVGRTVDWLAGRVLDFRAAVGGRDGRERAELLDGWADLIALELATGCCRCGHGGPAARAPVGGCGRPEHRLDTWRPDACRLHAFVATAVRGAASLHVRSGQFAVSMLAGILEAERRLLVGTAEHQLCHVCHREPIARAAGERQRVRLSELEADPYEVGSCPGCGGPPHPVRTYRVGRKNWMLVPEWWGGRYQTVHRLRCGSCGSLFAAERDRCPVCDRQASRRARPTLVWVRSR
jgi:hypothetical protein